MKANNTLKDLVNKDGLTSVFNHRYFQEALKREFIRAQRYDIPFAVVFIDLDDFKAINDTYGHLVGDTVLVSVAELIIKNVRETDLVARYGGEEFILLLPETDQEGAVACAENIRKNVATMNICDLKEPLNITISAGVALYDEDCQSAQDVVREADAALYQAKKTGKNKVWLSTD